MTKSLHNDVLDNGPAYLQANATREILCEGAPASYAEATDPPGSGGNALADVAVSSGDWTLADGDTDGREISIGAKSGVPVDDAGSADHLAVVDDGASKLLLVDELDQVYALTTGSGETTQIKSWALTLRDPT